MAERSSIQDKKGKNVSETVYNILRRNIINLNLVPGAQISEKEISEKMNVSRTPVREAFIKLSKEALVSILPQKGTFVSKIDLSRVQEERFLRETIEFSVMENFINTYTEEGIDRLFKNLERQKKALINGDLTKFIEYDDQFHSILFDETNKSMCYDVILSFSSHYRRIRYLSMSINDVTKENIIQHEQLLNAIVKKDIEEARKILKKHLRKLIIEEDDICERYPEYFEMKHGFLIETNIFENDNELINKIGKEPFIIFRDEK